MADIQVVPTEVSALISRATALITYTADIVAKTKVRICNTHSRIDRTLLKLYRPDLFERSAAPGASYERR